MSIKDGPGEGTWSVFAAQVVEQRDAAREELADARRQIEKLQSELSKALERDPDDPVFDATDFAHPAWWRAHDYAHARFKKLIEQERQENARIRASLGEQSRLILEAEERGAKWALEQSGHGLTSMTVEEYAKEICDRNRKIGILLAVAEMHRRIYGKK